ncbi:MAG: ribosomal protein S18-alanine N-acetyltransferase [Pisciglobus halotolerans]|nr:ribosomal protein S18-alanine N-acetyltransferase [Pisciglobus halotolerans]
MLKKFKEWLTNELIDGSFTTRDHSRLADRVKLNREQIELTDGSILRASLALKEAVQPMLLIQAKCYNGEIPWNASALHYEVEKNPNAVYIIVKEDWLPVGFIGAWLIEGEAHITNVAIIPDYQRLGIATWLIGEIEEISRQEKMNVLSLEVRVSNKKAQQLYDKLGFKQGRIKKGYYSSNHEDALEMSKKIKQDVKYEE